MASIFVQWAPFCFGSTTRGGISTFVCLEQKPPMDLASFAAGAACVRGQYVPIAENGRSVNRSGTGSSSGLCKPGQRTDIEGMQTLDEVLADAFRRFSRGVADRRSAFRSPALATVGLDGRPQVRTVVLRGFDAAARLVTVHSDLRAAKIAALRADPSAALHVWDDGAQVQVRIDGTATIAAGDDLARAEWARLHEGSRAAYSLQPAPATPVEEPADIPRVDEAAAFAQFAVLRVRVNRLEWLHLAREGQRRASFVWRDDVLEQRWLVP